jgi:hypothetical protein
MMLVVLPFVQEDLVLATLVTIGFVGLLFYCVCTMYLLHYKQILRSVMKFYLGFLCALRDFCSRTR